MQPTAIVLPPVCDTLQVRRDPGAQRRKIGFDSRGDDAQKEGLWRPLRIQRTRGTAVETSCFKGK
jgi:hypothetical protein